MERKRVDQSVVRQVYVIRSQHINGYGRLFGGTLMQWIDEVAGIVARRHSGKNATTAAVDNLNFKSGAFQNDMVVLRGKMTHVGRTSMEIRVDTYIEDEQGNRRSINRAYLVMVSLGEDGKPVDAPGLQIVSEQEKIEWESGEKRYLLRKKRRIEGY
ncbi:MAG: acyl-CoA thioesterase [Hespellia sp.]|nr:acyl-CoA thioesterase [Hespellia sp.]